MANIENLNKYTHSPSNIKSFNKNIQKKINSKNESIKSIRGKSDN